VGFRVPRSTPLTYVRCSPDRKASFSRDQPLRARAGYRARTMTEPIAAFKLDRAGSRQHRSPVDLDILRSCQW
jgi:hypothetical protein